MILPIFHSYASVNLKTLRLTVERKEAEKNGRRGVSL
jgi:hypothetical protein